jgi:transcriptional regulator with XRE-family HTH domain
MPAKKKFRLTDDELAALRARIRDAMAEQGLSQEGLAKRIGRKVETVKVYLGDPAYRTQRQPSEDFLARVERALGSAIRDAPAAPPPQASLQAGPDLEAVILDLLVRAGMARTDQLARRIGASETKAKRLLLSLYRRKLVDRVRETPATGRRQSQRYVYGAGREGLSRMAHALGRSLRPAFTRDGRLRSEIVLAHNLKVTDLAVDLALVFGERLGDWATDADCRGAIQVPAGKAQVVEPDLMAVVDLSGRLRCCWFEVETGSQGKPDVQRKAQAADSYYRSEAFFTRWGTDRLLVLWIGKDDAHARRLREWVGPLEPHLMHWFTSEDRIREAGLRGAIWLAVNGGDERRSLLMPGLARVKPLAGET